MAKFWSGKNDEYKAICQVLPANLFEPFLPLQVGYLFTHILSSNQFRLAYLPIFYHSKVFPGTVISSHNIIVEYINSYIIMYDVTTGSCMGYVYNNIPLGNFTLQ